MKKVLSILAGIATIVTLASCEADNTVTTPKGDEEGDVTSLEGYTIMTEAYAAYYGDYAENGTSNIVIELLKDATYDEDGYVVSGLDVSLDLYFPENLADITTGTFTAAADCSENTFATSDVYTMGDYIADIMEYYEMTRAEVLDALGITENDFKNDDIYDVYGSSIYYAESADADWDITTVDGGTVKILLDGTTFTILCDLTSGKETLKYAYQGKIEVTDAREEEDDDSGNGGSDDVEDLGDVTFNGTTCEVDYWGQDYGDLGVDYADWAIYIYEDGSEDYVELDIFTDSKADPTVLPTGEFSIKDDGTYYLYEPGCAIPFYYDEDNSYGYGCYYVHSGYYWYGATDGTVTITKDGENYTVAYNMYDGEADALFAGKYVGTVAVYDQTSEEPTSSRHGNKVKSNKPARYEKVYDNHDGKHHGHRMLK